ncbi:MAG: Isopentenyl-diphosphate delta-isomerase, type 2 [Candidatus Doudnabacteria bacterium]|nr:Isopentenyl-diphosphate delta-isomerase, type 2 [Candidatus Doudnabacteria bacterium]
MKVHTKKAELQTNKQFEPIDISDTVKETLAESGVKNGMALIFSNHTTAAIRINHNEPLLLQDFMKMLHRLVPVNVGYAHDVFEIRENVSVNERSNGHAHIKAFLLGSSETIPVHAGKLMLGEKQSIFFVEMDGSRKRDYIIQIMGD